MMVYSDNVLSDKCTVGNKGEKHQPIGKELGNSERCTIFTQLDGIIIIKSFMVISQNFFKACILQRKCAVQRSTHMSIAPAVVHDAGRIVFEM